MKISRKKLNIIIENFLFEQEEKNNTSFQGEYEIGPYTFEININKSGVDVNVKHKSNSIGDKKVKDEEAINKLISGIIFSFKNKKEEMQNLINTYNTVKPNNKLNNASLRKNLVDFRSEYKT